MANIGLYGMKNMLDWSLKAANPATPAGIFAGLSLGIAGTVLSSEVGTGSGYLRQTITFAGAATPAGSASASNSLAVTFGSFSTAAVISGLFLADTVSSNAGSMLWFGTLAAQKSPGIGDTLVVAAGALAITLS